MHVTVHRRNPYYQGIRSGFRQKRVVEKFGDRNVAVMKGKKSFNFYHDLYNTLVYKFGSATKKYSLFDLTHRKLS